jgi:A/G-specific adenine glycosylase
MVPSLLDWFAANARDLPWRRTRDPYAVWVSEIMLQQTQVKTVIPFWERWMCELPTIEAAANASSAKIHKLWEGLGYYTRVRNLQNAAQMIVNNHSGKFPANFDKVLALPGIGRYTAGAICSIAFNQATPILDGNVIRVLTRVFGIAENPKEKTTNGRLWGLAEELVIQAGNLVSSRSSRRKEAQTAKSEIRNRKPEIGRSLLASAPTSNGSCSALNQSLMELGALVCTPRNPQCLICPVKNLCVAFKEHRVDKLPNPGKRETATSRRFFAIVAESHGRFLVRQRPAGVVNGHLWEFPNVEVGARFVEPQQFFSEFEVLQVADPRVVKLEPLRTVKHSITRYRITLEAFKVSLNKFPSKRNGVWKTPAQMRRLAFTAAHKKLATAATKSMLSGR